MGLLSSSYYGSEIQLLVQKCLKSELKGIKIVVMILDPIMGSKMLGLRIKREENYRMIAGKFDGCESHNSGW